MLVALNWHGGTIYTMEIGKREKSVLFPPKPVVKTHTSTPLANTEPLPKLLGATNFSFLISL